MKGKAALTFLSLIFLPANFANSNPDVKPGAAAVNEEYGDEIKTKAAAIDRSGASDQTESGQVYDQEDSQDRGYQKAIEPQEEREKKEGRD